MRRALIGAALAAAAVAPATAQAATISYEGDTIVYRAAPGEDNTLIVDKGYEDGTVSFSDYAPRAFPADRCTTLGDDYGVDCAATAHVRVELGDGDDEFSFGLLAPDGSRYAVDGGAGHDKLSGLRADRGVATLAGGDGDDVLTSFDQGETLDGGSGDDRLEGAAGADVLRGGPGADALRADASSAGFRFFSDVIDGGPGADSLDDYHSGDAALAEPITITLDGVADDGRAGEHDDIRSVESFTVSSVGRFVGDDEANTFYAPEDGRAGFMDGRGGDDVLVAGDANGDEVIGGADDDQLTGGLGDDRIVGGPGRDVLSGDRPARCNEYHCDVSEGYGNDTIDARDGERDSVSCGAGADTVLADAIDVVAADCEQASGAPPGGKPGSSPALAVKAGKLRKVLRRGLVVRLSGLEARARVRVIVRRGKAVVASGSGRAGADGRAAVRARFTAQARRSLRGKRAVRLSVAAAGARKVVRLGR
jgi:Ca2+-binding RTX toxin-like protein